MKKDELKLITYIENGNRDLLRELISNSEININEPLEDGSLPLCYALRYHINHSSDPKILGDLITTLVQLGADPFTIELRQLNGEWEDELLYISPAELVIESKNEALFSLFLNNKKLTNEQKFFLLLKRGRYDEIESFLRDRKLNINDQIVNSEYPYGITPLNFIINNSDKLFKAGLRPEKTVELFLSNGADPSIASSSTYIDEDEEKPLKSSIRLYDKNEKRNSIENAIRSGNYRIIRLLSNHLQEHLKHNKDTLRSRHDCETICSPHNESFFSSGYTLLHIFAQANDLSLFKMVLEHGYGFRLDSLDDDDKKKLEDTLLTIVSDQPYEKSLHSAARGAALDIFKFLFDELGLDQNKLMNCEDRYGLKPLDILCSLRNQAIKTGIKQYATKEEYTRCIELFSRLNPNENLEPTNFYVRSLPLKQNNMPYGDKETNWLPPADKFRSKSGSTPSYLDALLELFKSYDRDENLLAQSIMKKNPAFVREILVNANEEKNIELIIHSLEDLVDEEFEQFFLAELEKNSYEGLGALYGYLGKLDPHEDGQASDSDESENEEDQTFRP